ncbi:MAG: kinase [Pseudoxanthomonas sp.]
MPTSTLPRRADRPQDRAIEPLRYLKVGTRFMEPNVYVAPYQGRPVVVKDYRRYRGTPLALAARLLVWREARMLRALAGWRHAPALLGSAGLLLGLELVAGEPVADAHDPDRPLLRQLGGLVAQLHASGILHNDFHASNLMVSAGTLVLLDYASAVRLPRWALRLPLVRELRRSDLANALKIQQRMGGEHPTGAKARTAGRRGWVVALQRAWKRWYAWAKGE